MISSGSTSPPSSTWREVHLLRLRKRLPGTFELVYDGYNALSYTDVDGPKTQQSHVF